MEYRQLRFRLTWPRATAPCGLAEPLASALAGPGASAVAGPGASAVDRGWLR